MQNKFLKITQFGILSIAVAFSLGLTQQSSAEEVRNRSQEMPYPRPTLRLQEVKDLRNDASTSPKAIRGEIKDVRKDLREENKNERTDIRGDIKDIRKEMKSGSTTRPIGLQEMRDRLEEGRKNIQQNRGEASSTIEKLRTELFGRELTIVKARLKAGVERLETIANRIDSRIVKLDGAGANTTDAKTKLAEARTKIAKAKADIDLIVAPTTTPITKDQMNAVKALVETAKNSVKSAQDALNATVKILGPLSKSFGNATSTNKTEGNN